MKKIQFRQYGLALGSKLGLGNLKYWVLGGTKLTISNEKQLTNSFINAYTISAMILSHY